MVGGITAVYAAHTTCPKVKSQLSEEQLGHAPVCNTSSPNVAIPNELDRPGLAVGTARLVYCPDWRPGSLARLTPKLSVSVALVVSSVRLGPSVSTRAQRHRLTAIPKLMAQTANSRWRRKAPRMPVRQPLSRSPSGSCSYAGRGKRHIDKCSSAESFRGMQVSGRSAIFASIGHPSQRGQRKLYKL